MMERLELDWVAATPAARTAMSMAIRRLFRVDPKCIPVRTQVRVHDQDVAFLWVFYRDRAGAIRIGSSGEPVMVMRRAEITDANRPDLVMLRAVAFA